ncbi:MAG: DUF4268 domain-containing protein [Candidatus Atribacteria bacterium]|nr:MAG: DUF4268 domain-containing protein [Candidatus Atribacteria bacterium]
MSIIGKLKKLDLEGIRKIWPHEENDLSPWIAENIDSLNEALNLQIEIESNEEYIYNFRLDLAGTENYSQMPVIIENQFGTSNHDHLGKLITYSAVKEAGIIIWIANEIQIAHRNAIEWLNRSTPQEMIFYGVELEVFQIDNSLPAPNFRVVAGPPPSKRRALSPGEISPRNKMYIDFFEKLRKKLLLVEPSFTRAKALPQSWWSLGIGRSGFSLSTCFTIENNFRVEIYIDTGKKEYNKFAFEELKENKNFIEEKIGKELVWDSLSNRRASRIYTYTGGSIDDNDQKLNGIIEWAIPYIIRFKDVFSGLIKNIQFES